MNLDKISAALADKNQSQVKAQLELLAALGIDISGVAKAAATPTTNSAPVTVAKAPVAEVKKVVVATPKATPTTKPASAPVVQAAAKISAPVASRIESADFDKAVAEDKGATVEQKKVDGENAKKANDKKAKLAPFQDRLEEALFQHKCVKGWSKARRAEAEQKFATNKANAMAKAKAKAEENGGTFIEADFVWKNDLPWDQAKKNVDNAQGRLDRVVAALEAGDDAAYQLELDEITGNTSANRAKKTLEAKVAQGAAKVEADVKKVQAEEKALATKKSTVELAATNYNDSKKATKACLDNLNDQVGKMIAAGMATGEAVMGVDATTIVSYKNVIVVEGALAANAKSILNAAEKRLSNANQAEKTALEALTAARAGAKNLAKKQSDAKDQIEAEKAAEQSELEEALKTGQTKNPAILQKMLAIKSNPELYKKMMDEIKAKEAEAKAKTSKKAN